MLRRGVAAVVVAVGLAGPAAAESLATLQTQVRETERAFAKTMADRDHAAFVRFLAEDAVFLGRDEVLRGRKEVAAVWKRYYNDAQPPFSWEPERVEVVGSGTLALSTGPVRDPEGKRIGTFTSTWRREKGGRWLVVLDGGCPPCRCP